jgi:hypothetical protein
LALFAEACFAEACFCEACFAKHEPAMPTDARLKQHFAGFELCAACATRQDVCAAEE